MITRSESGTSDFVSDKEQVLCLYAVSSPLPGRFLVKVDFRPDGCWIWTGATRPCGTGWKCKANPARFSYGVFSSNGQPDALIHAHRYSYQAHNGPIAPGLEIDHLCCNKLCVNPAHLEAVTHKENMARWSVRRRELRAKASLQEMRVTQ